MTEVITSREFDTVTRTGGLPVLVDVFSSTCAPCRVIAPIIDGLSADLEGQARVVKVNRDFALLGNRAENPLARFIEEKNIIALPALLLFDRGEYKGAIMGRAYSRKHILEWMEGALGRKFSAAAEPPETGFGPLGRDWPAVPSGPGSGRKGS